jgi:hypothetical protein
VCKKIIFFLALFYSSLQLGCSSATIVKRYYTNSKYSQGYGIVLCSILRLNIKPYYSGYDLDFLSLDNHKKYHFYLDPPPKYSTIKPDYRNDSAEGYYRAIILPVGKYKVFNFQLDNTYGGSVGFSNVKMNLKYLSRYMKIRLLMLEIICVFPSRLKSCL